RDHWRLGYERGGIDQRHGELLGNQVELAATAGCDKVGTALLTRAGSGGTHWLDERRAHLRRAVMIIANQQQVTPAVLEAIARSPDPRFREIMSALVRHLHDFAREVKLTEHEFQQAVGYVVALGQHTNDSHNEAVLMSGSLGFSTLICLLNNGNNGQTETAANLLGPFWRMHSPRTENGGPVRP